MTNELMKRSLFLYAKQFDSEFCYLSSEEMKEYFDPSEDQLTIWVKQYEERDYSPFFLLNKKIVTAIERARNWRKEWINERNQVLSDAKKIEHPKIGNHEFVKTTGEVKARHYQLYVNLVAAQIKRIEEKRRVGKEKKLLQLCDKQLSFLESGYYEGEDNIRIKLVKAMAPSLDAHTAYYSPDEAISLRTQLEKGMCGIGVILQEGINGIEIREIVSGGPAEKSGNLQIGDTILQIDSTPLHDISFQRVLEIMRGNEGSVIELEIIRGEEEKPEVKLVKLKREQITLNQQRVDVSSVKVNNGIIGMITLHSFYEGDGVSSEEDLKIAIDQLREKAPLRGLVLDFRENTGGFLSQAVKVSGLFMQSGIVAISKYFNQEIKCLRTLNRTAYYSGPLIILISKSSASAAEIVAQTLQDYGVALIVGDESSFGKGTIQLQTVTDQKAEYYYKVTVGRYYTVSGKSTQIDGVKADLIVPTKYAFEEMGESYLDYPLGSDQVASAYFDQMEDVDFHLKKWVKQAYLSSKQPRIIKASWMIEQLKLNSAERLKLNPEFQAFLVYPKKEEDKDLQMHECVNIIKDMILLEELAFVH